MRCLGKALLRECNVVLGTLPYTLEVTDPILFTTSHVKVICSPNENLLTYFSAKIYVYMLYDPSFNDTLTNDIVSFEQLGPDDFLV